ncbi:TPA: hypothetical protein H1005_00605 [archaeon]|uniref:K Homology domain-containing protein n=1 Tax=Candidatus Naiadarchaeum limnaeum TaxID=2756139 RepID=A0A832UW27_9ARCH|nr:hypothetical protein [Candidatus Naiadarchaeales archaeon SRR2090153.bin1042]HIK00835.1 hypothetical protein [Candidatus Naiadarchaeum limnaeum]
MKAPICRVCVTSDILCTGCEDKLKQGNISQVDIDLARTLSKLAVQHPILEHSEFKSTISFKEMLLVLVPKGMAGNFIGRKGTLIKEISDTLGQRRIKVVEETNNPKELVQRILYPAQLLGVNVVYSGKKQIFKVRISRADRQRIHEKESLEKLFEKLLGSETNIIFE